uniref:Odorant-binding protein 18 n=1 Tax=Encarsia formosa TaxID=32400 RepID=A0A514TTY5_ENCFO|nr:odorant-binding protein 18 [Encarsia formosa]
MSRVAGVFMVLAVCLQAISANRPDFITDEVMEMIKDDKARCMAEHGTTEALIDEVNNGHLPNDKALTCYMFCLFEAFSLVDEDANLEVDMLIGFLPESMQSIAHDLIEKCAHKSGADPCDKIFNMAKCVQDERPDLWFMV